MATVLTDNERQYDKGNKGYLTKFERQVMELDDGVENYGVAGLDDYDDYHQIMHQMMTTMPPPPPQHGHSDLEIPSSSKYYQHQQQQCFHANQYDQHQNQRLFSSSNNNNNGIVTTLKEKEQEAEDHHHKLFLSNFRGVGGTGDNGSLADCGVIIFDEDYYDKCLEDEDITLCTFGGVGGFGNDCYDDDHDDTMMCTTIVDLSERRNYQNYTSKVQREIQQFELLQLQQQDQRQLAIMGDYATVTPPRLPPRRRRPGGGPGGGAGGLVGLLGRSFRSPASRKDSPLSSLSMPGVFRNNTIFRNNTDDAVVITGNYNNNNKSGRFGSPGGRGEAGGRFSGTSFRGICIGGGSEKPNHDHPPSSFKLRQRQGGGPGERGVAAAAAPPPPQNSSTMIQVQVIDGDSTSSRSSVAEVPEGLVRRSDSEVPTSADTEPRRMWGTRTTTETSHLIIEETTTTTTTKPTSGWSDCNDLSGGGGGGGRRLLSSSSLSGLFRADSSRSNITIINNNKNWKSTMMSSSCRCSSCLVPSLPIKVSSQSLCCSSNKWRYAMAFGSIVILHLVGSIVLFYTLWQKLNIPWGLTVDSGSGALLGQAAAGGGGGADSAVVSTMGRGRFVQLDVIEPPKESFLAPEFVGSYPYACVDVEVAVDLWRSTMHGMPTNIVLVHSNKLYHPISEGGSHGNNNNNNNNKATADETSLHQNYYSGIRLSFQGATRNETHACLPAQSNNLYYQKLCIDLVSGRCNVAASSPHHFDFQYTDGIDDDDDDDDYHSQHSKHDCNHLDGHWCTHSRASILIVSNSS